MILIMTVHVAVFKIISKYLLQLPWESEGELDQATDEQE